jgi:hypothetical protein
MTKVVAAQRNVAHQRFFKSPSHLASPNGLRLSGEGGEADRVRCSRGLGNGELRNT